jgi:hypothetical protein
MAYIKMLPGIFECGHATVDHNLVTCPTMEDYRHYDCRRDEGQEMGRERWKDLR